MPAVLAAAALCVGGAVISAFALSSHGAVPDSAASVIPATIKASVPKPAVDRHAKTLKRSVPVRIRVPAIGVNAPVTQLGLNADGTVQVPPLSVHNLTGWYKYGVTPGQRGASVILGHVDSVTGLSVFFKLKDLHKGEKIYVLLADGQIATFVIDGLQKAAKTTFPTNAVYGKLKYPGLRLVTCGGDFDPATGHYLDNIIVYAHLTASDGSSQGGLGGRLPPGKNRSLRTASRAAWVRSCTPNLASTELTCALTVFSETCRARAISRFDLPLAISASTSRSRTVSDSSRPGPPGPSPAVRISGPAADADSSTLPSCTAWMPRTSASGSMSL
jgi:sortase (surface protein transpeptidase)